MALPCNALTDALGACRHNDNKCATPEFQQCSQQSLSSSPSSSSPRSSLSSTRIGPLGPFRSLGYSNWSFLLLYLSFLLGGNQTASEEFSQFASWSCVHNSFVDIYFLHWLNVFSSGRISSLLACYRSKNPHFSSFDLLRLFFSYGPAFAVINEWRCGQYFVVKFCEIIVPYI